MMLCFDSHGDRDAVTDLTPITHDDARLTLERAEETSNRFTIEQKWLMAVSAVDFRRSTRTWRGSRPASANWVPSSTLTQLASATTTPCSGLWWPGTPRLGSTTTFTSGTQVGVLGASRWDRPSPSRCCRFGRGRSSSMSWGTSAPSSRPPGGANSGGNTHPGLHGPAPPFGPVLHGAMVGQPGWAFDGLGLSLASAVTFSRFVSRSLLPRLPIIIPFPACFQTDTPRPAFVSRPLLALPWYDDDDQLPAPPLPTLVGSPARTGGSP